MRSSLPGLLAGAFSLFLLATPVSAQADVPSADSVKASFVYNFSKFVEWPANTLSPGATLQLCVAGQPLEGKLKLLNGRQAQGHDIRVRGVSASGDISGCHILFIGASEERRLSGLLAAASGNPVLTISDIDDFAVYGGMIGLSVRDERVGFAINLTNTRAVGLKPSAQLLRLGQVLQ